MSADSPAFGQADLTNCDREQIHLAGSVQPHGVLLLVREGGLQVLQASANCLAVLGVPVAAVIGRPLAQFGSELADPVAALLPGLGAEPVAVQCSARLAGRSVRLEGAVHRAPGGGAVVELEVPPAGGTAENDIDTAGLQSRIAAAAQRFATAAHIGALSDAVVRCVRDLTGYDRVMVYRFDPDGHGKIIAEACDERLDSLLGHHYPASDIPQRARELYLRNRVRMLVDVDYVAQPLVPPLRPDDGQPLDMSLCQLRSMSPLHLQYLRNMGVTATLVASLVREGRLWGLIAAHHYRPRHLRLALRAAVGVLAEVASTRIAAIDNQAHAQSALMVRRLEQRLVEATSSEGDWRPALFRSPRTVLQPLQATGAALFQGGEILSTGEVPSTPEMRALCLWVDQQLAAQPSESLFCCSAVAKVQPPLASLTPTASGVLAVRLSTRRPDYLMWFRKEQLQSVTWAGNPAKPVVGNDPLQLSPRRSFAAWSEIVRGSSLPWTAGERTMARAIGSALADIIVQVDAVRLLIAEHQLEQIRGTVDASREPVLVADAQGRVIFANHAFAALRGPGAQAPVAGTPLAALFGDPDEVRRVWAGLALQPWRGVWSVAGGGLPVAVRAEVVPGRGGALLGGIVRLTDLSDSRRTADARRQLESALLMAGGRGGRGEPDAVIGAILTNASLAAMDIAESADDPQVAGLLEELEASAQRATALYAQLLRFSA